MTSDATISFRRATQADAEALDRLDAEAPLIEGGKVLILGRVPDYLAHRRLMGPSDDGNAGAPVILVAESEGRLVGVYGGVVHTAQVGRRPRRLRYLFGVRVAPDFQGRGLGREFLARLRPEFGDDLGESMHFFVAGGNQAATALAGNSGPAWETHASWGTIETAGHAGAESIGRACTEADAVLLAEIFNAGHVGEQMFLPYTPDSLSDRLGRVPEAYTWHDVQIGDGAAVGVWSPWCLMTEQALGGGAATQRQVGLLVDYGCLPGHERELAALLRGAAARAQEAGTSQLGLFTSPGSRLRAVVEPFFDEVEDLAFWTPAIPEPPESRYGLYVDPVYF